MLKVGWQTRERERDLAARDLEKESRGKSGILCKVCHGALTKHPFTCCRNSSPRQTRADHLPGVVGAAQAEYECM